MIGITSRPIFDAALSDMLELTRDMRQKRAFSERSAVHNIQSSVARPAMCQI
jgi:hypothetical protein